MRNENSGKIITALRVQDDISLRKLAKGLCSLPTLSRIESCERIPDKLLLDTLLQRLGKASDKLEAIMGIPDYQVYLRREQIEEYIISGEYEEAKKLIDKYLTRREANTTVHRQYILKIKAILSELEDHDMEKSKEYIDMAIKMTMPEGVEEALKEALLSKSEIQLILMKIYHCNSKEDYYKALDILDKLDSYVKKHYTDEEELAKIYAKIVLVGAKILLDLKMYEKAVEICEYAVELLRKNDVLTDLYKILVMLIEGLEHIDGRSDELRKLKKWETTLRELFIEYDIQLSEGSIGLLVENRQCEILLIDEIIRRERKAQGLSQEELCENICTPENLSAVENGKRAPTIKNYDKLVGKLGLSKDYYISILYTEIFEVQELRRECNRLTYLKKYEEAERVLNKIEKMIDLHVPVNAQYIMFNKALLQYRRNKITKERALKRAIRALDKTIKYNDGDFKIGFGLSQEEVKILNFIGIIYRRMGQIEKTVEIYKKALQSYESSKVTTKKHYFSSSLLMSSLCMDLEEMDEIYESMEISEKGIKLALECGRATMIPSFLANKACCLEKAGKENEKACMKYLQQAFYINDIIKNEYNKSATEKYYFKCYGEIDWY